MLYKKCQIRSSDGLVFKQGERKSLHLGGSTHQILSATRCSFLGFFRNPRTIILFLFGVVLCFLLSSRVTEVAEYYGTTMQAAEPFIWTFGDSTAILLISLLLILLFSDLPKLTPFTPFHLMRTTKKRWLISQLLYIMLCTALYILFILTVTAVLCMKYSYTGDLWSETAAILGYSSLGDQLNVPSTVKVMESITPIGCMLQVALLMFAYSLALGFLILPGNLLFGKKTGMFFALLYSLYGFLLDPDVLGKMLGLETWELYRVRSIVGWISPLNNAVYGMHDFGYDNLPSIAQSLMIFGGILAAGIIISWRAVKKYNFTFLGT
ncbi:MAG: hypothetical protein LIP10_07955 [Clostridiales bacterium]|nr:hypothetical protein [Clostridiales bacterium]